ncbi:MAG: hypothetical protein JWN25_1841 [Verrucomicrobiales bacterium]|nr:hypothetical protein [Verrucomicrobiales bacterium]
MKSADKKQTKEDYNRFRALSWTRLWTEEVPLFNQGSPEQRLDNVALIRAVGVVFIESGSPSQKAEVRTWLLDLLNDPQERIRRYAVSALPKIGAGLEEEAAFISLLQRTTSPIEKKFVSEALNKIGGSATIKNFDKLLLSSHTQQKVKAAVARSESPSSIRLYANVETSDTLAISLRCRLGLEKILCEEVEELGRKTHGLKVSAIQPGVVTVIRAAPFNLASLFALRCFDTLGFVLASVPFPKPEGHVDAIARIITSPGAKFLFQTLTEGSIRYRLDYVSKGHQRSLVKSIADQAFKLDPSILNDSRSAPWVVEVYPLGKGYSVELAPKLADPRLFYRLHDVPASSHPPLAACMARLAGNPANDIIWDPFCGAGLELVERTLRGGVTKVYGTDLSTEAVLIAHDNFSAANLSGVDSRFVACDFRQFATFEKLEPGSLSLIITNPPMGKRVPVENLKVLIHDLFAEAARLLKPGGRLIFANPLWMESPELTLRLQYRQTVDFNGFNCRLEKYNKLPR